MRVLTVMNNWPVNSSFLSINIFTFLLALGSPAEHKFYAEMDSYLPHDWSSLGCVHIVHFGRQWELFMVERHERLDFLSCFGVWGWVPSFRDACLIIAFVQNWQS